jgi:hypothetical protein
MADADIDGVSLGLASESARARHIDAGTGRLNIPAEYADAYYSPPKPDVRRAPVFEERGLAAYALDLLDQRLPGLYDTMVASREDPQLVGRVKERIDGISPGLYDYLAAPLVTSTGYAEKLTAVVKMLGLENEPVRHLHGLY